MYQFYAIGTLVVLILACGTLAYYAVPFVRQHSRRALAAAALGGAAVTWAMSEARVYAQETPTIEVPIEELFSSINTWIGVFLPILGIGGGIIIGIALINLVINMIRRALQQAGSGN